VGLNPFREQVKRRSDIVIVAAALVVVAALVAWGLFSG
jgi:chorismate synthase